MSKSSLAVAKLAGAILVVVASLSFSGAAEAKTQRSAKAVYDFKKMQPCPSTGARRGACPGYVIDHVVALKRGGADHPSNMQWQTREDAKAKDKWE